MSSFCQTRRMESSTSHVLAFERNTAKDFSRQHNGNHHGDNHYYYYVHQYHYSDAPVSTSARSLPAFTKASSTVPRRFVCTEIGEPGSRKSQEQRIELLEKQIQALNAHHVASRFELVLPDSLANGLRELVARAKGSFQITARGLGNWLSFTRDHAFHLLWSVSVFVEKPIYINDSLARKHTLQYECFRHGDVLQVFLERIFKDQPGAEMIKRGAFVFEQFNVQGQCSLEITSAQWSDVIQPGASLGMSMIFSRLHATTSACPACGSTTSILSRQTNRRKCAECHIVYTTTAASTLAPSVLDASNSIDRDAQHANHARVSELDGNDVDNVLEQDDQSGAESDSEIEEREEDSIRAFKRVRISASNYACTWPGCTRLFDTENTWKSHEIARHGRKELRSWVLPIEELEHLPRQAGPVFPAGRPEYMDGHLLGPNLMISVLGPERHDQMIRENSSVSETRLTAFWCGFCTRFVLSKPEPNIFWNDRSSHIINHLGHDTLSFGHWLCIETGKPLGERTPEDRAAAKVGREVTRLAFRKAARILKMEFTPKVGNGTNVGPPQAIGLRHFDLDTPPPPYGKTAQQEFENMDELSGDTELLDLPSSTASDSMGYISAACNQEFTRDAKFWPRRDNFIAHIRRKHQSEWDIETLLSLSRRNQPDIAEPAIHHSSKRGAAKRVLKRKFSYSDSRSLAPGFSPPPSSPPANFHAMGTRLAEDELVRLEQVGSWHIDDTSLKRPKTLGSDEHF